MHTPGPWTVDSDDGIDFTILGGKTSQVCIAVETSERDAHLIAAAPDLLQALQALEWAVSGVDYMEDEYAEQIAASRAAIARAIGK